MIDKFNLSGNDWLLKQITKEDFLSSDFTEKSTEKIKICEYIPAEVPGNVRLDLLKSDIIEDPFIGMQNENSQWVSDSFWKYKKEFNFLELDQLINKRIFLHFKKTDYYATYILNGVILGKKAGMFRPSIFDITHLIKKQKNILLVLLGPSPIRRWRAVKCQMSYGWDFAPKIVTMGIWDDVEIFTVNSGRIIDHFIYAQIDKIKNRKGINNKLFLNLDFEYIKSENQELEKEITLNLKIEELNINISKKFSIMIGINKLNIHQEIPEVELWYPNCSGDQKLYEIKLEIKDSQNSELLDKIKPFKFGFRKVSMIFNPKTPKGNEKWTFMINDQPEFIRGANWVPLDSFFGRIKFEKYEKLILKAKNVNMNMFRVWGGGISEKESFFELCNEHGIMIWNEFPFACSNYPNVPVFMKLVKKECESIIQQIKNQTCLIAYVGGNEWNPKFNSHLVEVLKEVVKKDPTRIFYPVSPCAGDLHDWAVWHSLMDFDAYKVGKKENYNQFQFFSEFGLQSAPDLETVKSIIPEEKIWPLNKYHKYHNAEGLKLMRYGKCVCEINNIKSFVLATQIAQAEGLKYGIEHCRKEKPEMSGVLFWQLNEPWPSFCWSIIDYNGNEKIAYEYLKNIYNPIIPILEFIKNKNKNLIAFNIFVVNDFHESFKNSQLKIEAELSSRKLYSKTITLDLQKESSLKIGSYINNFIKIPKVIKERDYHKMKIKLVIYNENKVIIGKNSYYPFRYRENLDFPSIVDELSALGAYYINEKFWFIYEFGKILGIGM